MNQTINDANKTLKKSLDDAAGVGTADKTEGAMTKTLGSAQQKIGETLGNRELEARGVVNEESGKRQEAVGETKEAVSDTIHDIANTAHNIGENIKEGANRAVADIKEAFAKK